MNLGKSKDVTHIILIKETKRTKRFFFKCQAKSIEKIMEKRHERVRESDCEYKFTNAHTHKHTYTYVCL